ncbi:NAD(P)H-hydrate epimerase [Neosynechococcus sphagnicola]|uniref:NAD(P)H-hydrate epimerase n=1 Tax=Neosynechococcus sphagnicola TaxID=1501145 RepID=UPI000AF338A4|nr:NAD(P)H-hydrate epimerase [Neosynechococcus sphagnicola]
MPLQRDQIQQFVVTAAQMRAIEGRVFAAGMPATALMEKVGGLISHWLQQRYSAPRTVGVLVGPGHNGGDALVVARELHFRGYDLRVYCPFSRQKELTATHAAYVASLGIPLSTAIESLQNCDLYLDGLFGFGLERPLETAIAAAVNQVNQWGQPVISLDLPSGLHTDSGEVLGTAMRATHTLCLGLWKRGLLQDHALEFIGEAELIDFDLPLQDIQAVLGEAPVLRRITTASAIAALPFSRPLATHKYQMGHLLLIAGSQQYLGAAILAGLAARATGVGLLSLAVPASLKSTVLSHLPDALVIDCPETTTGAIALDPALITAIQGGKYSAIACGPGITAQAVTAVEAVIPCPCPLVLDADALTILATLDRVSWLAARPGFTVLTPRSRRV